LKIKPPLAPNSRAARSQWSPPNFATKHPFVDRLLPNQSAAGASALDFINGLGALNQDAPAHHP
jgi:hypothetical protein